MEARRTAQTTIGTAVLVFAPSFAIFWGMIDGLAIVFDAGHLFSGFLDRLAFLIFAMTFYAAVGVLCGAMLALILRGWPLRNGDATQAEQLAFYFSVFAAGSMGALLLVRVADLATLYLHPVKNVGIVGAVIAGTVAMIWLLYSALRRRSFLSAILSSISASFRKRAFMTVAGLLMALSIAQVLGMSHLFDKKFGKPAKPNIILISLDTLSARHLSCYGYSRKTSPHLDSLAAQSVLFENNFSVSRSTLPSHMSMMTSVYPAVHRATDSFTGILDSNFVTLAEVLKEHGYATGAFVDGSRAVHIGGLHGFDHGFDFYEHYPDRFVAYEKIYLISHFTTALDHLLHRLGIPDMHSERIFEGAISWLRGYGEERPFFLFIHDFDIHDDFNCRLPYVSPQPFQSMYYPNYAGGFTGCGDNGMCGSTYLGHLNGLIRQGRLLPDEFSRDDVTYITSLYDAGITYVDNYLGMFFKELDRMNLTENTLLIITSDHGDEMMEHDQFKHTQYYDEILNVPLLMRYPVALPGDRRVKQLARSIDILPTILDLVGIPSHEQFQGSSLVPYIAGEGGDEDRVCFGGQDRPMDIDTRFLRTPSFKYIHNGATRAGYYMNRNKPKELYELASDPTELVNVVDKDVQTTQTLQEELERWSEANLALREKIVGGAKLTKKIDIDEKSLQELKSLGYIK